MYTNTTTLFLSNVYSRVAAPCKNPLMDRYKKSNTRFIIYFTNYQTRVLQSLVRINTTKNGAWAPVLKIKNRIIESVH